MSLITLTEATTHYGLSRDALKKITAAGLLPASHRHGRTRLIPRDVAERLSTRPTAPLHEVLPKDEDTMPVLRVDVAQPVKDQDRPYIGFHADLAPEHLLEALRGWWVGDPKNISRAGILPITLGGFVVAVLTGLDDWESRRIFGTRIRHRFHARLAGYLTDLDEPTNMIETGPSEDQTLAKLLLGTRLPSNAGGPIAYAGPAPTI
ncbi:hypothetical protein AB0K18_23490 [Nonomuraea sp. NPDC049421]|uniref:hypothetical protein n=1 Tax=Nonomuraea sp. NPDC049421 TaxID=3155275 RepID=UPI00342DF0B9